MNDFSHLVGHEEDANEDQLAKITRLAKETIRLEKEWKDAEQAAKEAKKRYNKVSMEFLPEAMMDAGIKTFEMENGSTVSYKEEASASVVSYTKLGKWLEDFGDDALIKTSFDVQKLPKNIVNAIMKDFSDKYGVDAEIKEFIHPQTLKAYVSRKLGLSKGSVAEVTLGDIDEEMLSVFTYYKSKIKIPKG